MNYGFYLIIFAKEQDIFIGSPDRLFQVPTCFFPFMPNDASCDLLLPLKRQASIFDEPNNIQIF